MISFENLYAQKDNPLFVSGHLTQYLITEIYSPHVIRQAAHRWREMPFYARESVHLEIRDLIDKAATLSNAQLQGKINTHLITLAIKVLFAYSHCSVPLTFDKSIPVRHENFLSDRGKTALKALFQATARGKFTHEMADLAVRTSHKFLMDLGYYRDLINSGSAEVLTLHVQNKNKNFNKYLPPIVQLTKGCPNHCSHCLAAAGTKMSYMPYPMWRKIHQKLNSHYKYFHGKMYVIPTSKWINWLPRRPKTVTFNYAPFDRFFHDSDPSSYYDPIIGVDAGDISLLQYENKEPLYFLTRGITDPISRRAIAKTALVYPIDLSFVDTPKEKMTHNITQLKKTIKLIHSVPNNQGISRIWHTHLKSGPSVSDGIFLGENVMKTPICPSGRANQFHPSELDMDHPNAEYPFLINPNGDVVMPYCINAHYVQEKLNNIFAPSRERE